MIRTIEQLRAEHAYRSVNAVKKEEHESDYRSYVSALPANILQNGLGQAMAMELAADRGSHGAHEILYQHVQSWLCATSDANPNAPYSDSTELLHEIMNNEQLLYVQAQSEAMAYLEWLKKFSSAFLKAK